MTRIQGSSLPLGAAVLGVAAFGVGLLLFALGVEYDTRVLGRIAAGWAGIMMLSFAIGVYMDFGPKRKKDG